MAIIVEADDIEWQPAPGPSALFITDLDGTLLRSDRTFADADLAALRRLGAHGVVRVLATGRSLYSFNTVHAAPLPLDYLIFSTGAGVTRVPDGKLLRRAGLDRAEVRHAVEALRSLRLDFMVQRPIPDGHVFGFMSFNSSNPDFEARISRYRRFAFPLHDDIERFGPATQLVAIVPPPQASDALAAVRGALSHLTVIRTTSPLDGRSTWIEIFPAEVSKSRTAGWLASRLGIARGRTFSVGNDYNDLDLLEWAGACAVTANAPDELKRSFPGVASNDHCGVAEAVERWLTAHGAGHTASGD